ncbi:MAG TPA: hypothetical protein VGU20_26185 [Stellaceae bacterium]|nr:hypothetical protein [Stellaceae bacterium]
MLPAIFHGNLEPLVNYDTLATDSALSIPNSDHYVPLLVPGSRANSTRFPVEGG